MMGNKLYLVSGTFVALASICFVSGIVILSN
jgi:hypothetical protein